MSRARGRSPIGSTKRRGLDSRVSGNKKTGLERSPVRKYNLAFLVLAKLGVNQLARFLKIACDAIVGDLAFELWAGELEILRIDVLGADMRGKDL